jgi:site-specific DNA recombinase
MQEECRDLERQLAAWHSEIRQLLGQDPVVEKHGSALPRLADIQERIRVAERRLAEVNEQLEGLARTLVDEHEVAEALAAFDPVWETLTPQEQARLIHLLVECVDYDGSQKQVSITFHPTGIRALADELAAHQKEKSA